MGYFIRKAAMYIGKKVAKVDPTDIMTQDTVTSIMDVVKEVLLP